MTTLDLRVEVCTFCYTYHKRYCGNLPFKAGKNEAVQKCFVCKQNMCATCLEHSQRELNGSILTQYGLEVCRSCIAGVWRQKAMKPRLIRAVKDAVEYVRNEMMTNIYSITHDEPCPQGLKQ